MRVDGGALAEGVEDKPVAGNEEEEAVTLILILNGVYQIFQRRQAYRWICLSSTNQ